MSVCFCVCVCFIWYSQFIWIYQQYRSLMMQNQIGYYHSSSTLSASQTPLCNQTPQIIFLKTGQNPSKTHSQQGQLLWAPSTYCGEWHHIAPKQLLFIILFNLFFFKQKIALGKRVPLGSIQHYGLKWDLSGVTTDNSYQLRWTKTMPSDLNQAQEFRLSPDYDFLLNPLKCYSG